MVEITTNRDLYFAVLQLIAQYRESNRSLEDYLRAMVRVTAPYHEQRPTSLTLDEFVGVLADAFTAEPYFFSDEFQSILVDSIFVLDDGAEPGYLGLEYRAVRQIFDLAEMAANGQLKDESRYLGIEAPHGDWWSNFDPCSFLECATRGSFIDGVEDSPIGAISWEQFRDFLGTGQAYE
jgi:hypothetical protein